MALREHGLPKIEDLLGKQFSFEGDLEEGGAARQIALFASITGVSIEKNEEERDEPYAVAISVSAKMFGPYEIDHLELYFRTEGYRFAIWYREEVPPTHDLNSANGKVIFIN